MRGRTTVWPKEKTVRPSSNTSRALPGLAVDSVLRNRQMTATRHDTGPTTIGTMIGTTMKSDDDRDKDRDDDRRGANIPEGLGHEKLRVYRRGLDYVTWSHPVLAGTEQSSVVLDHWIRAAESILENIANGNSRRSRADRNHYFDVASGSSLECAACLDICRRRWFASFSHHCLDHRPDLCRRIVVPILVPIVVVSPRAAGSEYSNHTDHQ